MYELDSMQASESEVPSIEVIYCTAQRCYRKTLPWRRDLTVKQALDESGLAEQIDFPHPLNVGIFGHKVKQPNQHMVDPYDRIELYRPLTIDPKEIRRKRAARFPVGRYRPGNQWRKQQSAALKSHADTE